jgi:hypothetical protein
MKLSKIWFEHPPQLLVISTEGVIGAMRGESTGGSGSEAALPGTLDTFLAKGFNTCSEQFDA